MAYNLYTRNFGATYANAEVIIRRADNGAPAVIMASATGGTVNHRGMATLDGTGGLSVYIDDSYTWTFNIQDKTPTTYDIVKVATDAALGTQFVTNSGTPIGGWSGVGATPVYATPTQQTGLSALVSRDGSYAPERPTTFAVPAVLSSVSAWRLGNDWGCSVRPEDLIDTSSYTRTYFVNSDTGSNSNTGLSWAQRVQTIGYAMRLASASGLPSRILVDASAAMPYYRQLSAGDDGAVRASAVPIVLEAMNGRVQTGVFDNLTWTKTGGLTYVYQATRSSASRVVNPAVRDLFGISTEYTWVASTAACDALEGSWYTDGTTTYVHPHGHMIPSLANCRVLLQGTRSLEWNCNQNLLVRGFDFFGGAQGSVKIYGGSTNTVVLDDCTMRHASAGNTENGSTSYVDAVPVNGVGLFAAFDCAAEKASSDGFGLHAEGSVLPTGLLVRCKGRFNGRGAAASCNGYTTHDGVKSISIGGDWRFNAGIGSAHVNAGTQAWCIGDIAGGSAGDVPNGGTFIGSAFGAWAGAGGLWLDACRDLGAEIGVYGDTSAPIYLRNHRGSGQRLNVSSY